MRTANPALNEKTYYEEAYASGRTGDHAMTINGAVAKTGFLTAILIASAGVAWMACFPNGVGKGMSVRSDYALGFVMSGLIGGLVAGLLMMFRPKSAPIAAPLHAVCEGLFLGAFSGLISGRFQGIVLQAAMLTIGVLAVMLLAYGSGLVRATEKFKLGVIAATGAVGMVYLATILLSFFGIAVPYIHAAGPIGIGFSLVVIVIAALNLVLDFDMIETGARVGSPKYMEWYTAYGLLTTLVWLYIEFVRLLIKVRAMMDE